MNTQQRLGRTTHKRGALSKELPETRAGGRG